MRIIFVRHGQTTFNSESRYQGHTDSPLDELGCGQAARVAERLRHEKIAAIYSSDLSRAHDTARTIAGFHDLPIHTDSNLRESQFGEWEGLTVAEITQRCPDFYALYVKDPIKNRAPGGERLEDMQARVVRAVISISERHDGDNVIVVTHGGPIRAFLCHALDTDFRTFRTVNLANCSLTVFSKQPTGDWLLECLNDVCHLLEILPAATDKA